MTALKALLLAVAVWILYFAGLGATGLLGPDEPRYASIGREMARSGDWVTPRLWGEPWFEKPALLYWMTAAGFRLGLSEDLAPRLPVALVSVAFLVFFQRVAVWRGAAILGTSAGWLAFSSVGVTDLPMAASFAAAMLLAFQGRAMPAGALLGVATLAKGLVPLVLALPLAWFVPRVLARMTLPFLAVATPWYILCYLINGLNFFNEFFMRHHWGRFASPELQHPQPFWFYLPVLAASLLPWTPLLFRLRFAGDRRTRFLMVWALWGLLFFSLSSNKLPGYLLPLLPALAALLSDVAIGRRWLAVCAATLVLAPVVAAVLPQALAVGLSRAAWPGFHPAWLLPLVLVFYPRVWTVAAAAVVAVGYLKLAALPAIERTVSARPLWQEVAPVREQVCVERMHRAWRYGLNYYSVTPLPDCSAEPRPRRLAQDAGGPARLDPAPPAL